jgi:TP901 family phage tail tape measure protein
MPNIISVVMTGNVSPLTAALAQGAAQLGRFGGEARRLGGEAQAAATQANRLGTQAESAAGRVSRLGAQADAAAASAARLRTQADAGGAGAARLGAQADAAAARAARLRDEAAAAGTEAARLGRESRLAGAEAERLGAEAERAGQRAQLMRTGMQAGAVGVALLGAGLVAAVGSAIQFEASMRNVASIDQTVADNFEEVSQAVLDMSKHLPQSANELAKGLYNIAGSGFYGADALHILEVSATAASAGLTTTDTASKAVVASLNAYGLEASEAGRVSDALFSTVNYGVISFEALTTAVAHSVGNAARAGVSIEELGTALATMTLSGMSASEAGVSLNNLLAKLLNPSKELTRATSQLGISLKDDLANPAIGLHGVMEKLRIASEGNVGVLLRWFPEIRSARGAMALFSADGENYARVFGQMGDQQKTAGETARVFGEQAKSTKHQLEILANQVAVTGIELGMTLLPAVNQGVEALTRLGGALKEFAAEIAQRAAPGARALADVLRDLVDIAQDLHLDDIAAGLARLGVGAAVAGFNALATALSTTTGFLADNRMAVITLVAAYATLNITGIVGGLAALGAAAGGAAAAGVTRLTDAVVMAAATITRTFGNGSLARGMLVFGAAAAVATGSIYAVVSAFDDVEKAAARVAALESQVGEILGAIDPSVPASYDAARVKLDEMAAANQRATAANQGGIDAIHQTVLGLAAYDYAVEQVNAQNATMQSHTNALAEIFGLTGAQVQTLAQRFGLDLTTGLQDAADGSAGLETKMRLAIGAMLEAAPATLGTQQQMNLLTFDVKAADEALAGLTTTFDLLTGRLVSGAMSANNWQLSMIELASRASLARDANGNLSTSLDTSSEAGLRNQNMLLGLVQQLEKDAQAQYNATVATEGADAAAEAYNDTIAAGVTDLLNFGAQAGISEGDIRALIGEMNLVPDSIEVPVTTPGLDIANASVSELRRQLALMPRNIDITIRQNIEREYINRTSPGSPASTHYATGGQVTGPGGPTSDQVPIMASNGEWVISADAARRYGPRAMAALNEGRALVVPRMAAGGPVRGLAVGGPATGTAGSTATGATGAIQLVEQGGQTLAEVYSQTAAGVDQTTDALRDVVPRLWEADRSTGYLATTTGLADQTTGLYRETLTGATADLGLATLAADTQTLATGENTVANTENLLGLQLLGVETDLNNVERSPLTLLSTQTQTLATQEGTLADTENLAGQLLIGAEADLNNTERYPLTLLATQTQTLATQEETLANTERLLGMQLIGVETDLNVGERMPAVLVGTQTQTLATQESTLTEAEHLAGLTLLGTQWDLASGVQLPTLTAATDTASESTTAYSATLDQATADLVETTGAVTETTTAVQFYIDTSAQVVPLVQTEFTTPGLAEAQGSVDTYIGSLNSVPTSITTTITTAYVTTGAPPAGSGFARGGMVTGPGTSTSDSILAALSAGEWVIRAQAAAKQGPYRMALLNAGLADVVPRFAAGGPVPGFATGGMVRPANYTPFTAVSVINVDIGDTTVTVNGAGPDAQVIGRVVRTEVDGALSDVVRLIRSGTGRR